MWRVSTAPVDASASMGVNKKKFWLLINVTWTGRSPAQRRASSTAAVTPANPPPRITILGASEVDGLASTRPAAGALIVGVLIDRVAATMGFSLSSSSDKPLEQRTEAIPPGRRVLEPWSQEGIDPEAATDIGEDDPRHPERPEVSHGTEPPVNAGGRPVRIEGSVGNNMVLGGPHRAHDSHLHRLCAVGRQDWPARFAGTLPDAPNLTRSGPRASLRVK